MGHQIKYHQLYLRHATDIGYVENYCLHHVNGRFVFVLRIVRRMLINVPYYGHLLLQLN